ncbi:hypothetical protein QTH91_11605 [Variovorax dokdonensis]|uniref:Uncharacterized protein n=1 Tax=Variovorax dokdonensis TaxID=344883 RepID=A0ABT7NB58_9BURK|nr:hypothetical protein [Variovorax dokdonensis]MDM0045130.1 hypothetical protein [Variovorax dokdonensis]
MSLDFLLFDDSEGDDETALFDAMACVVPEHEARVEAEIATVIAWAERSFPGRRGPIEEGGEWDADLQVSREQDGRRTYALSITGTRTFAEAFREHFAQALG